MWLVRGERVGKSAKQGFSFQPQKKTKGIALKKRKTHEKSRVRKSATKPDPSIEFFLLQRKQWQCGSFETEGFMFFSRVIYIIVMQKGKKWPRILNIVKSVKYLHNLVKGAASPPNHTARVNGQSVLSVQGPTSLSTYSDVQYNILYYIQYHI